ncbi:LCP family protein [Myceligenerans indicum]|uniref:LytR family transcriptional regulator n=1 Tax=Myceligenerans indicum TaxID=2593663 RepID=A0ABS1LI20_9MICO|nr:LCP family protein [Myceligenerans indicum]MBL0885882.1 LytR family transcriptional regulator [Myceligenerans indicum]
MSDPTTDDDPTRVHEDARAASPIPPSFTPQQAGDRPGTDGAIAVGDAAHGAARPGAEAPTSRPRPPAATPGAGVPVGERHSEPRIKRQSSREVPVSGGKNPPPVPPRSVPPQGSQPPQAIPPRRATGRASGLNAAPVPRQQPPASVHATHRPPAPVRQRPPGGQPPPPGGGQAPPRGYGQARPAARPGPRRRGRGKLIAILVVLALLAWPVGLMIWANGKIQHVEALSGAPGTPGTTYLIAGSDARGSGGINDSTSGARTDTILLLHKPASGPTALISLPRDTYAEIPGVGMQKLNAAYAFGGPELLVQTVEQLSGLTIDHYAEVGFGGVSDIVDAVGGVELCYDHDVDDQRSRMKWTAGCHEVTGEEALAFSRMRYSDPQGDIGRAKRQRQVIGKVGQAIKDPALLLNPAKQVSLADAGLGSLSVDEDTGVIDMAFLALRFQSANGENGVTGTPPIASLGYNPGNGVGSTVLLGPEEELAQFWTDLRDGNLEPGEVNSLTG